ncbi:type VI secretion protein [Burkholderia puraquae]|uniref:Actin cross-linking toxin VgrG1 n=1 Tax=Burkholderia puraquae TaxID=1904757 RepID=A0A1X1P9E8_9BURK|nr:type VI secretion system tip protein TssI/VgrG [Burkholderia puraquae]ORT82001.1 type VI secretion protein [Burkholderia puraquae]CAB3767317.1 Actin cross-linking toxin VgrG1 [Burkholderia puraquae]
MSFAPIGGSQNNSGGSPLNYLAPVSSALGGLSGPLVAGVASHLGPLAGVIGHVETLQRAAQLAQTGFSLLNKTPASIADAINATMDGAARLTQDNRYVTIDTPLGPDVLLVSAAIIDEHVSRLPEIHLDLLSHRHDLRPEDLIGQKIQLKLDQQSQQFALERIVAMGGGDTPRYFDGYVASFDRAGPPGRVTQYQMTVVPWFWLLTRSTDCRIFQNKTAQDILVEIFQELGFADYAFEIYAAQKPLEYVVMYQESYYSFCARLMEQEGLFWTHRYTKEKHTLVIGDSNDLFQPIDGLKTLPYSHGASSEFNGIDRLDEGRRFGVGKVTYRDFNHQHPASPLMLVNAPAKNLQHAMLDGTERYEYQSLYDHSSDGERYANQAMEAEEAEAHRYSGSGYSWRLTTAGCATVTGHPVVANNQEYVFLHVRHEVVNDYTQHSAKQPYRNTFTCLPRAIPYRAQRVTPKPVINGTQSAIVVGPKGEQIHTDGSRVKVHFIWDRRGKMDGADSMWVRVSQPWAGDGWGAAAIPRIGQEVTVAFTQGDPDNPLIIGRVYNGGQGNPYHGSAGQTMGIKSQTHKGAGSNELRMTDTNGAQELYLHAQKDMNTVVQDAQSTQVLKGNRSIAVDKGNHTTLVSVGNLSDVVSQGDTLHQTPAGTHRIEAKELWISIGGKDGTSIHMTADFIEIRKGGSVVRLDDSNIKVQAARTDINPDNN